MKTMTVRIHPLQRPPPPTPGRPKNHGWPCSLVPVALNLPAPCRRPDPAAGHGVSRQEERIALCPACCVPRGCPDGTSGVRLAPEAAEFGRTHEGAGGGRVVAAGIAASTRSPVRVSLRELLKDRQFTAIVGIDVSSR